MSNSDDAAAAAAAASVAGVDATSCSTIVGCLGCLAIGVAVGWFVRSPPWLRPSNSASGSGVLGLLGRIATGTRVKMVLVMRADVGMSRGKAAAQAAHAAVACYRSASRMQPAGLALRQWELLGQPKVTLRVDSEAELLRLADEAKRLGLPAALISDAGRTEVKAGTATSLGIGPAPEPDIDQITGRLRLF